MVKNTNPPPEDDSSLTVKDHWKFWVETHKVTVKKDIARYLRTGTEEIFCKLCRKSISVDSWL